MASTETLVLSALSPAIVGYMLLSSHRFLTQFCSSSPIRFTVAIAFLILVVLLVHYALPFISR